MNENLDPRDSGLPVIPHPVEFRPKISRREYVADVANLLLEVKQLKEAVYIDKLTGLLNRRALDENLPALLETARSTNTPLAILRIDIDGLKKTNDGLGLAKGDALIRAAGPALQSIVRPGDLVGRDGGDEFFVLMPGFEPSPGQTQDELSSIIRKRARQTFADIARSEGIPDDYNVGLSIGIATLNDEDTPESLLERANQDEQAEKKAARRALEARGIDTYDERLGGAA